MDNCIVGEGYGRWGNAAESLHMSKMNDEERKAHVKKLWQADPEKYFEWKQWCIDTEMLPDFFGTRDNPIHIDESKL